MNHKFFEAAPIDDETPNKRESILGFLMGLGYLTVFAVIPAIILKLAFPEMDEMVLTTGAQLITIVIVVFLMMKISKRTLPTLIKGFSFNSLKTGSFYVLLMYAASILWGIIDILIFGDSATNANQASLFELANLSPIFFVLLVVIGAPLIEELIFRYYIYKGLEPRSPFIALIVSAIAFSMIHLMPSVAAGTFVADLRTLPSYLIPSFLFAIAYYKTKRLSVTLTAHVIYNLVTVLILFIQLGLSTI